MAKQNNTTVVVSAIAALVVIECTAMYFGFNGTLRIMIVGAIAALAGLVLPTPKILKK